jgi:hypothetical protein
VGLFKHSSLSRLLEPFNGSTARGVQARADIPHKVRRQRFGDKTYEGGRVRP